MKKLPLLLAALVSTSALASGAAPTTPDAWMNAQPSLELTVEPAGSADTYSVQAVITDKVTGKVLERPTMVIKGGAWGRAEIGAAWTKSSNEGREYLSVKLDDPSFTAPIFASLFADEDGKSFNLIWSRGRTSNGN